MTLINQFKKILFQIYISFFSFIPTEIGIRLRYYAFKPLFKNTKDFFRIDTGVTILGFENISLGSNVRIMKNSYLYAHDKGNIEIGNNFDMNTNSQLGASFGKIVIGNNCSIASNCVLRAANHNFQNPNKLIIEQGHDYGEIILEDDIWIASNSVITANVRIGKGSVIGAGSVVTKNILPYSIVYGNAAQQKRKRELI